MPLYKGQQDPLAHVIDFLETVIHGYAVGDLGRLGEIRPDPKPPNLRGCAIPECLAIFAVLDLLGFLMRKDFTDDQSLDIDRLIECQLTCAPAPNEEKILRRIENSARNTFDNLKYMLEKWVSRESEDYDELTIELIIKLFRHGGAHQFLPKAARIAKWGRKEPLIKFTHAGDGFPTPILHEDRFRDDSLTALERMVRIVKDKDQHELKTVCDDTIEELAVRMSKRLAVRHWLDRDLLKKILLSKRPDLLDCHRSPTPWGTPTLPT